MTYKISLSPRGKTTKSKSRYLIYADGSEVGTCRVVREKWISSGREISIDRITLYSNVVKKKNLSSVRKSIFEYFKTKGYRFEKKMYYCEKHGAIVVYIK